MRAAPPAQLTLPMDLVTRKAKRGLEEAEHHAKLYRRADGTANAADQVMPEAAPPLACRESIFGSAAASARMDTQLYETDEHKVSQRQKQIDHGKNTLAYDRYLRLVPRRHRDRKNPTHLRTPNPREAGISKRQFDGRLREWRRKLHEFWDAEDGSSSQACYQDADAGGRANRGTVGEEHSPGKQDRQVQGPPSSSFCLDDYLTSSGESASLDDRRIAEGACPQGTKDKTIPKISAETPSTCATTKTAPLMSISATSQPATFPCPSMADVPLQDDRMTKCAATGAMEDAIEDPPAKVLKASTVFDLDSYLGDQALAGTASNVPNGVRDDYECAVSVAAMDRSNVRARLNSYKVQDGKRKRSTDIYAAWDGDDSLIDWNEDVLLG